MNAQNFVTDDRRARMAAERRLEQTQAELHAANRRLSNHAIALSEDLVETREAVEEIRGENLKVRADLDRVAMEGDIAKRRLWNSLQTLDDGFAVFDADARLVIANDAYLATFDGLECIKPGAQYEEIIEAALSEGVVDLQGETPEAWREAMLARWFGDPKPQEVRLWDGTWLRFLDSRAPGGDTVSLRQNITDAKRQEAVLETARAKAEEANRAKSAFLANMSHEIRTPMNGVIGMADLLAESPLDDDQSLYVDTIRSSGQALLSIINDVLDYSKIEAKRLQIRAEDFDLERVVLDVLLLMESTLRDKGLKVILDYDMFLPNRFEGDALRIRQVFTNLIGNAVKFTEKGHVLVRVVGLPEGEAGTQRLHVIVEDTGIGIAAEKLAHVFGEFNQVEDERNRAYEGTGLGLAITRQLVELMGGKIWVESELGVGSAFGFQLSLPVVGPAEPPRLPGWMRRALLVMSDDLTRMILEKQLAAVGLNVRGAVSAEAAYEASRGVDVVFADSRLPDSEAEAFIAGLRARGVAAPVVLVAPTPEIAHLPVAGAETALVKPLARTDLVRVLQGLEEPAPVEEMAAPLPVFASRRGRAAVAPVVEEGAAEGSLKGTPPVSAPAPAPVAARAMRVLAAEDNKTNQLVFSKLVKACDIDLRFAGDGLEAVAAYEAERPDLVFMDISMPGMDGKEATAKIRALEAERGWPRCRIVALTAHAMDGDADEILRFGLDAYLTKPLKKPAILDEIGGACPEGARAPLPLD